jgi:tripartite-type tricarboxylate transporter receptor subunit TctC
MQAVPTADEQGLSGVEASAWSAFYFPKGTPDAFVRKLNRALNDALDNPSVRARLEELGFEIVPQARRTPEYLAKFLPEEIERWSKAVQAASISAD